MLYHPSLPAFLAASYEYDLSGALARHAEALEHDSFTPAPYTTEEQPDGTLLLTHWEREAMGGGKPVPPPDPALVLATFLAPKTAYDTKLGKFLAAHQDEFPGCKAVNYGDGPRFWCPADYTGQAPTLRRVADHPLPVRDPDDVPAGQLTRREAKQIKEIVDTAPNSPLKAAFLALLGRLIT